MCNLYSMVSNRTAIRRLSRVDTDWTDNHPPLPAIFPDQFAPVITQTSDSRRMTSMRWGFPCPPSAPGARLVTNVRNTASPYWRTWLRAESRCLVPVTAFCEYADEGGRKVPTWFALDGARSPFAFAGIWRTWRDTRGSRAAQEDGEHSIFAFLTAAPNAVVAPVHPKAMPVILTANEGDEWLSADVPGALAMQRPAPDDRLVIVARGEREDRGEVVEAVGKIVQPTVF